MSNVPTELRAMVRQRGNDIVEGIKLLTDIGFTLGQLGVALNERGAAVVPLESLRAVAIEVGPAMTAEVDRYIADPPADTILVLIVLADGRAFGIHQGVGSTASPRFVRGGAA